MKRVAFCFVLGVLLTRVLTLRSVQETDCPRSPWTVSGRWFVWGAPVELSRRMQGLQTGALAPPAQTPTRLQCCPLPGSDATAFARRASSGIQLLALLGLLPPLSRRPLGTCLRPQRLPQLVVDTCVGVGTSLVGRHGRADRHAPEALTPARGNMMTIISVAGCA